MREGSDLCVGSRPRVAISWSKKYKRVESPEVMISSNEYGSCIYGSLKSTSKEQQAVLLLVNTRVRESTETTQKVEKPSSTISPQSSVQNHYSRVQ